MPEREVLPRLLARVRRVRLFVRDYMSEFGCAWSIARYRDCDRNGGHPWGPATDDDAFGLSRTCRRCGTLETLTRTQGTANTETVYVNATNTTGGSRAF